MASLKPFTDYLKRPFENFEYHQIGSFSKIIDVFNSGEDKDYEINSIGFLKPAEEIFVNRTKQIIEEKEPGYTFCSLVDIPLRKTKQVVRCLVPTSQLLKKGINNTYYVCISFTKFRKKTIIYESRPPYSLTSTLPVLIIDDFEIESYLKLRATSSSESKEAEKLRNDILFNELDFETPANVKVSILNSLFLSPKIKHRAGIESKALICSTERNRLMMNSDSYNQLITSLIPPEISNCHEPNYRGDTFTYVADSIGEKITINIKYPENQAYQFKAVCMPFEKEDKKAVLRMKAGIELGLIHQSSYQAFSSKKQLIDKLIGTEFFYQQDYLAPHAIQDFRRAFKVLKEHKELLYADYVSRLLKQLPEATVTTSETHKAQQVAEYYLKAAGYKSKTGFDSYKNSVVRLLINNLTRVKTVLPRSNIISSENLGVPYLVSMDLNLQEITDKPEYGVLPNAVMNMEKISKVMNNPIRAAIVNSLKTRGNSAFRNEILVELIELGFEELEIEKQILNLKNAEVIDELNNILTLDHEI